MYTVTHRDRCFAIAAPAVAWAPAKAGDRLRLACSDYFLKFHPAATDKARVPGVMTLRENGKGTLELRVTPSVVGFRIAEGRYEAQPTLNANEVLQVKVNGAVTFLHKKSASPVSTTSTPSTTGKHILTQKDADLLNKYVGVINRAVAAGHIAMELQGKGKRQQLSLLITARLTGS